MPKGTRSEQDTRRRVTREALNRLKVAPSFLGETSAVVGGLGAAVHAINTANRAAPGAGPLVTGLGMVAAAGGALALSARSVDSEERKRRGQPRKPFYQAPSSIPSLFRGAPSQEAPSDDSSAGESPTGGM